MNTRFFYLHNKEALEEIRRHKWLESEKKGREIGFATAAYDWISKYGEEWKKRNYCHESS